MRIGVNVGHFVGSPPADFAARIRALDAAGFASLWFAEAYGSDVFTPMAFCAALTSRVRLGAAVAQLPARAPTATAMAAMTPDHLSGGRVVLGLGASGPQVSEGWQVRRDLDRWDTCVVDEIAIQGLPDDVGSVARLL